MRLVTAAILFVVAFVSAEEEEPYESPVLSLNDENWDATTAGKTVFVKFFAPWCGHCKAMAPDWEKLYSEWVDHDIGMVAEVDCTADEATNLCQENGIEGFPTLKYGDPSALEDYNGGRDYDSLAAFAKENLKPVCSLNNLDLCDDEKKAVIEGLQGMSVDELKEKIGGVEKSIENAETERDAEIEKLQETYEKLMEEFEAKTKAIKAETPLALMKAVLASKKAAEPKEEL